MPTQIGGGQGGGGIGTGLPFGGRGFGGGGGGGFGGGLGGGGAAYCSISNHTPPCGMCTRGGTGFNLTTDSYQICTGYTKEDHRHCVPDAFPVQWIPPNV